MSASLLQKSLKLSDENKEFKKKNLKKKKLQNFKRRDIHTSIEVKNQGNKEAVLNNIRKLEQLDTPVSINILEKIFSRKFKPESIDLSHKKEEEKTVFTDKDFEEFEKEYLFS